VSEQPTAPPPVHPLIGEAMKKAGLVWIAAPEQPAVGAWYVWDGAVAHVLTGPGEQQLPGLAEARGCTVAVRSNDHGGRILTWAADVTRVTPNSTDWPEVTAALVAKRLNLRDHDGAPQRWAAECAVLRLVPVGVVESGSGLADDGDRAAPRPTPATTPVRLPYVFGRRRRQRLAARGRHRATDT
jgi:hypothetical protein